MSTAPEWLNEVACSRCGSAVPEDAVLDVGEDGYLRLSTGDGLWTPVAAFRYREVLNRYVAPGSYCGAPCLRAAMTEARKDGSRVFIDGSIVDTNAPDIFGAKA